MKTAIIMHGKPSREEFYDPAFPSVSNYYWLPWLQKQLAMHDIPTYKPEVPNGWIADYKTWQKEFERYDLTADTMLVGHSCGAGFLLRWLSEHPSSKVNKVVLASLWTDPRRVHDTRDFFDFKTDPDAVARTAGITIINSDNDFDDVQETVRMVRGKIHGIKYMELHNRGHFYDEQNMEFPEILDELLL